LDTAPRILLANPSNWRIHPGHQQDVVTALLERVGWVREVLVNTTTGHVVDGHLRVQLALRRNETSIPVSYVELTVEEEREVLAALDPAAGLAAADASQLRALLQDVVPTSAPALDEMFRQLAADAGFTLGAEEALPELPEDDGGAPWEVRCTFDSAEHYVEACALLGAGTPTKRKALVPGHTLLDVLRRAAQER
jgi:hypothetical protein